MINSQSAKYTLIRSSNNLSKDIKHVLENVIENEIKRNYKDSIVLSKSVNTYINAQSQKMLNESLISVIENYIQKTISKSLDGILVSCNSIQSKFVSDIVGWQVDALIEGLWALLIKESIIDCFYFFSSS